MLLKKKKSYIVNAQPEVENGMNKTSNRTFSSLMSENEVKLDNKNNIFNNT